MTTFDPSGEVATLLRGDAPLLVLTGAGVSAESGLATFRGPGGLWEGHDPAGLATPEAFRADPALVWRFYRWRRQQAAGANPNAAHRAIAALQRRRGSVTLVTQNVDGLHERAGSERTIRLHGSLWRLRCSGGCGEREDIDAELGDPPPLCACGALLRPGVVWFGEALDPEVLERAQRAAETARLVLVVGTSSVVYPAAALPEHARRNGARVIEINPETTALTPMVDEHVPAPAGTALPRLAALAGVATEEPR